MQNNSKKTIGECINDTRTQFVTLLILFFQYKLNHHSYRDDVLLMNTKTNSAYLLITCNDGQFDKVITHLEQMDNIKEIQGTCGAYDIIAKAESITSDHLQDFIIHKIRTLANVRSTLTLHYET